MTIGWMLSMATTTRAPAGRPVRPVPADLTAALESGRWSVLLSDPDMRGAFIGVVGMQGCGTDLAFAQAKTNEMLARAADSRFINLQTLLDSVAEIVVDDARVARHHDQQRGPHTARFWNMPRTITAALRVMLSPDGGRPPCDVPVAVEVAAAIVGVWASPWTRLSCHAFAFRAVVCWLCCLPTMRRLDGREPLPPAAKPHHLVEGAVAVRDQEQAAVLVDMLRRNIVATVDVDVDARRFMRPLPGSPSTQHLGLDDVGTFVRRLWQWAERPFRSPPAPPLPAPRAASPKPPRRAMCIRVPGVTPLKSSTTIRAGECVGLQHHHYYAVPATLLRTRRPVDKRFVLTNSLGQPIVGIAAPPLVTPPWDRTDPAES